MKFVKKTLALIFSGLFIFAMLIPAFADEDKTIKEVRLTVTEPKAGEAPDMNIVSAEPDKYTAKARYWIKKLYGNDNITQFEGGYEYGLVFEVTPVNGYKFEAVIKNKYGFDESPVIVYMNDQETHCVAAEKDTLLVRAYDVTLDGAEEPGTEEPGLFEKIINAIKNFFAGIINFFKNLF